MGDRLGTPGAVGILFFFFFFLSLMFRRRYKQHDHVIFYYYFFFYNKKEEEESASSDVLTFPFSSFTFNAGDVGNFFSLHNLVEIFLKVHVSCKTIFREHRL